jgi:hypothetical protein
MTHATRAHLPDRRFVRRDIHYRETKCPSSRDDWRLRNDLSVSRREPVPDANRRKPGTLLLKGEFRNVGVADSEANEAKCHLQERLEAFARDARHKAKELPAGIDRDALLHKASKAETACHFLEECVPAPKLQPSK